MHAQVNSSLSDGVDRQSCLELASATSSGLLARDVRQWRRQDFVTGGGSEVWVYRGSSVQSPPVPAVLSVYQRASLLDGLAMYLSRDTNKFHDNESTHILHNFRTSTHRGEASFFHPLAAPLV